MHLGHRVVTELNPDRYTEHLLVHSYRTILLQCNDQSGKRHLYVNLTVMYDFARARAHTHTRTHIFMVIFFGYVIIDYYQVMTYHNLMIFIKIIICRKHLLVGQWTINHWYDIRGILSLLVFKIKPSLVLSIDMFLFLD